MTNERRPLVAGNWKMNGLRQSADMVEEVAARLTAARDLECEVMICPPATLLAEFADSFGEAGIVWGAQDCHADPVGAHTGDLSAEMLADAGARAVIVGHSERRRDHRESDAIVRAKAEAAHRAGLTAIVCIGETEQERDSGETLATVERQVRGSMPDSGSPRDLVLAYEPVWAIGTGRTATPDQIQEVHRFLRELVSDRYNAGSSIRILYGGSVNPSNAAAIFALPDVDGGLIGGASLKADDFWAIIGATVRKA